MVNDVTRTSKELDLSPCPHCGRAVSFDHIPAHKHAVATFMPDAPDTFVIECVCGAGMCGHDSEQEVRGRWNARAAHEPRAVDPFVVKHYASDERPSIKGNGFDGLEIGQDRQDAEEFVAWVNAQIGATQPPLHSEGTQEAERWIPYLEAEPKSEPYLSIASALRDLVQFHDWALPQITPPRSAQPPPVGYWRCECGEAHSNKLSRCPGLPALEPGDSPELLRLRALVGQASGIFRAMEARRCSDDFPGCIHAWEELRDKPTLTKCEGQS